MNYNPRMGFSEQDYHLLKTHQSSGGIKQELFIGNTGITRISFDNQHNYMFDIVCSPIVTGSYNFSGSTGCNISKVGTSNPTNVGTTNRMIISISTNLDNGTDGQIVWGGVIYNITITSGSSWTIKLPDGYYYYGIKTEVGDAENEI